MLNALRPIPAARLICGAALVTASMLPASAVAESARETPLGFFAGKTEMVSTVKVVMKKPYRSKTIGSGKILGDGSLSLAQQVFDEGEAPKPRHWKIHQVDGDSYLGTMSEAVGPVVVDEVDGRYRFKFRLKGNLSVEQWMTPMSDGDAARSNVTVRKFGLKVATSTGVIRKVG